MFHFTRNCEDCGVVMKDVPRNTRFCPECREKHKKDYENKHKATYKVNVSKEKARVKETSLNEDVREAERLGLSYGKYMLWKQQHKTEEK